MSEKIHRGQKENRKKGLHCGGNIAYGYKSIDRKLYINEYEAEAVRFMYKEYGYGVTVARIIEQLTERGYMYKGAPFRKSCIYSILRNKKYIGIYEFEGEIFTDIYTQIITLEDYERVRARMDANRLGSRSVKTVYLLRGKLICGYCGKPISAENGTSHSGKRRYYYKCVGRKKHKNGCTKTTLKKELLEEFVVEFIIGELKKNENIDKAVDAIIRLQEKQAKDNPDLNNYKNEKNQVEVSLGNLLKAIEAGVISNTTTKRLHELEERLTELERKILIEECKKSMVLDRQEIDAYYVKPWRLIPND